MPSVRFLDAEQLIACDCATNSLYLLHVDLRAGTHRVECRIPTEFAGRHAPVESMDFDGRAQVVTSHGESGSLSLYRLTGNRLSFVKEIPAADNGSASASRVRFTPNGDMVCACSPEPASPSRFISVDTHEIVYRFGDEDHRWRPVDCCFVDSGHMVVVSVDGDAIGESRTVFRSKIRLVEIDLVARRHTVLTDLVVDDSQLGACAYGGGRIYVIDRSRERVVLFKVDGHRFTYDGELGGFGAPDDVDVLTTGHALAVAGGNGIVVETMPRFDRPLHKNSSVLAVVTHYSRRQWLGQVIESLVGQTRRPKGIVVVDDASPESPLDIVQMFPGVTLLAATENVGPYRLLHQVTDETDYEGYLMQDSDDWSAADRLAVLLAEAERTGAEAVGCQMISLYTDGSSKPAGRRPLDPNAAYADRATGHFVLMPTSLIARGLLRRTGGLASGLRFSGDGEFFRRAHHVARLANVPDDCYFRRRHLDSMTGSPDTGPQSPARRALEVLLHARAKTNAAAAAAGRIPDLTPFAVADRLELRHVAGPPLQYKARTHIQWTSPMLFGAGDPSGGIRRDPCLTPSSQI